MYIYIHVCLVTQHQLFEAKRVAGASSVSDPSFTDLQESCMYILCAFSDIHNNVQDIHAFYVYMYM